ncbi:hypothetical protein Nepgr_006529 [Nepenthes gracilis]|uniref:Uncharacterized protein n=1 Tax=Nepenthes gracilis TaxID=150966 RepID=A0AAD3S5J3_NEPGR|nr:hypothetical protein Nepgr_006529 [Nepenthes gracilis]
MNSQQAAITVLSGRYSAIRLFSFSAAKRESDFNGYLLNHLLPRDPQLPIHNSELSLECTEPAKGANEAKHPIPLVSRPTLPKFAART